MQGAEQTRQRERRQEAERELDALADGWDSEQLLRLLKVACAASAVALSAVLERAEERKTTDRKATAEVLDWFRSTLTEQERLAIVCSLHLSPVCGGCLTCSMCSKAGADATQESGSVLALQAALATCPDLCMDVARYKMRHWRWQVAKQLAALLVDRMGPGDYLTARLEATAVPDQGASGVTQPQEALLRVVNASRRGATTAYKLIEAELVCLRTVTPVGWISPYFGSDDSSSMTAAEQAHVPGASLDKKDAIDSNTACFVLLLRSGLGGCFYGFSGTASAFTWPCPPRVERTEPKLLQWAVPERLLASGRPKAAREALSNCTRLPLTLIGLCVDYVELPFARKVRESRSWQSAELSFGAPKGEGYSVAVLANRSLWDQSSTEYSARRAVRRHVLGVFPTPREWAAARRTWETPVDRAAIEALAAWDAKNDASQ